MARLKKPLFKRGEVWITSLLGETRGKEIGKKRPGLIVSANIQNSYSDMIVIVPISSQLSPQIGPDRIILPKNEAGLEKDSIILVNHIRAIDKSRLLKKITTLTSEKMAEVEQALKLVLGISEEI